MQDRLNALVLRGEKVATAGLWQHEYVDEGEDLDVVGERQILLGEADEPLAEIEVTRVERIPFAEVTWEFAEAEGEGFTSIEDWRNRHQAFYAREGLSVGDDDLVVCLWFKVITDN
jgi:uncharacterized protein YhfF